MKTAIITITRNEPFFLPLWISYYRKVDGAELHVLDHESDDGSTDNLPDGVVKTMVHHPEAERALWMLRTVQDHMRLLLSRGFERVIYTETDEFLIPDPARWANLEEFLNTHNDPAIFSQGWNVVHQPGDAPLGTVWPVLNGRSWKREPFYDLLLVANHVPNWKIGRHGLEDRPNGPDVGLRLVHLHFADRDMGWERIQARQRGKPFAQDGCGWQNKVANKQEFDRIWNEQCAGGSPIPEAYWSAI